MSTARHRADQSAHGRQRDEDVEADRTLSGRVENREGAGIDPCAPRWRRRCRVRAEELRGGAQVRALKLGAAERVHPDCAIRGTVRGGDCVDGELLLEDRVAAGNRTHLVARFAQDAGGAERGTDIRSAAVLPLKAVAPDHASLGRMTDCIQIIED